MCLLVAAITAFASAAGPRIPAGAAPRAPADGVWSAAPSGTTADLTAVSFADSQSGHAVGSNGTILATNDGGRTWSGQTACHRLSPCQPAAHVTADLAGVSFVDHLHGWAVGVHGTIVATSDGGRSWTTQVACAAGPASCAPAHQVTADLAAVSFVDPLHGWAVGTRGTVLATVDGGRNWLKQTTCADPTRCDFDPAQDLTGVSFTDPLDGWVVGRGGDILYTADGGTTWGGDGQRLSGGPPPRPDMLAVSLTVPSRDRSAPVLAVMHAVGGNGAIYATQPESAGWQRLEGGIPFASEKSGTPRTLRGVWFTDALHGHAVGDGGTLLATNDGGTTWTAQPSGATTGLSAVDFPDANHGFAVGAAGAVFTLQTAPPEGLTVRQVVPQRGPTSGAQQVTILGTGLRDARAVNFGTIPADGFADVSDSRITAVLPVHAAGLVDVTVSTPAGVSGVSPADRFDFQEPAGGSWRTLAVCPRDCSGPAVLLHDGRVLIEGAGLSSSSREPTNVAELYDPATSTWTLTSPMHEARAGHTATLLADGRVLVAGGEEGASGSMVSATAELYEPGSGAWTMTGSMHDARAGHTATRLSDGRVLVAGGEGSRTAELYDPRAGRWMLAGTMERERYGHTATLLHDGRVLVVGGADIGGDNTTEIYDPRSNTWRAGASLSIARVAATATLLGDGRVLVAGGFFVTQFRPNTTVPYAELYDPHRDRWSSTGPMAFARAHHAAVLLPTGRVLVVGGGAYGSQYCPCGLVANVEEYDPHTGRWEMLSAMPVPREDATATRLQDGSVLVAGGGNPDAPDSPSLRDASVFMPASSATGVQATPASSALLVVSLALAAALSGAAVLLLRVRLTRRRARRRPRRRVPAAAAGEGQRQEAARR